MNAMRGNLGWIEVICGPMFSGKSEELIRRLRRAEIARQRVQIFKPIIDQRYASDQIVSHDDGRIHAEAVSNAMEVQAKLDVRTEVIGIDEAQFLGEAMIDFVVRLADMGKRIVIAGLDTDYLGRPFHPMPELLAVADEITKTLSICMQCGNPAKHTQRLIANEDLIVVGAAGMYEARCRRCFEPILPLLKPPEKNKWSWLPPWRSRTIGNWQLELARSQPKLYPDPNAVGSTRLSIFALVQVTCAEISPFEFPSKPSERPAEGS